MVKVSEMELKRLVKGGETNTVELKLAAPRAVDLAERLCGMANARGGIVIIGVEDSTHKIVGVSDERIGETMDVILRAARQVIKPELVLISAGFDADARDPIGSLGLNTEDFTEVTRKVLAVARTHAKGRVVSCLEGGYNLDGLTSAVSAHSHALALASGKRGPAFAASSPEVQK